MKKLATEIAKIKSVTANTRTIGDRVKSMRTLSRTLRADLEDFVPEASSEYPADDIADAGHAVEALTLISSVLEPPDEIAGIKVKYRPTPDTWDTLDAAKDMGDEVREILIALEAAGHSEHAWHSELSESLDFFNEFA